MAFWFRARGPLENVQRFTALAFDFDRSCETTPCQQLGAMPAANRLHTENPSNVAAPPEAGGAGYPVRGSCLSACGVTAPHPRL